jgi:tetratricopeptide (TPR) repeat protein
MELKAIRPWQCFQVPKGFRKHVWHYSAIRKAAVKEDPPGNNVLWAGLIQALVFKDRSFLDQAVALVQNHLRPDMTLRLAGKCLSDLGFKDEALEKLRRAMAFNPTDIHNIGELARQTDDPVEGLELFDHLLKADANNVYAWIGRASVLAKFRRSPESETCLRRAIELSPKSGAGRFWLAFALLKQARYVDALKEYKKALRLRCDERLHALVGLAVCYYQIQKFSKAKKAILKALKLDPDDKGSQMLLDEIEGRKQLGVEYFEANQFVDAYPFLRIEALREESPGRASFYLAAMEAECTRDPCRIESITNVLDDAVPKDVVLRISGWVKFDLGLEEEGLAAMRASIELNPTDVNRLVLANCLARCPAKRNEARRLYEEVLEKEPAHWSALFGLACVADSHEEARDILSRGTAAFPDDPECHYRLAKVLMDLERFKEAISELEEARRLKHPWLAEVLANMAECFLKSDHRDWAIKYAKQSLLVSPSNQIAKNVLAAINRACSS